MSRIWTLQRSWGVWVVLTVISSGCSEHPVTAPTTAEKQTGKSTVDQVCEITAEQFGVDRARVDPGTSLGELGADELDFVELVMVFEERFGITIPDDAAEGLLGKSDWQVGMKNVTMTKLADLIARRKVVVD